PHHHLARRLRCARLPAAPLTTAARGRDARGAQAPVPCRFPTPPNCPVPLGCSWCHGTPRGGRAQLGARVAVLAGAGRRHGCCGRGAPRRTGVSAAIVARRATHNHTPPATPPPRRADWLDAAA